MTEKRTFKLFSYNSWFLIISLVGLGILGAGILFLFQGILDIPNWIQYVLLTFWLAADFIFSSFAAARSVELDLDQQGLKINNLARTRAYSWNNIQSFRFYDELLLNSIKIRLIDQEMISIIDFKWRGNKEIYGFLEGLYAHLGSENPEDDHETEGKKQGLIQFNLKTILGMIFFMVYVNISLKFDKQGYFYTWNPIFLYFYWILPVFTFIKLVFKG